MELDAITESAELSDHARRPVSCGAVIERRTVFFIASPVVQDLPDQSTQPVSDEPNRLRVAQARDMATIEELKEAALVFDHSVGGLIEQAA